MICYWVNEEGSFGIAAYRENRGRGIADRFHTLLYDDIGHSGGMLRLSAGAQIFSALDRLSDCQRTVLATIWDAHARAVPHVPRLNDPRRVLLRFELLQALHEQGLNNYRVFRTTDLDRLDRFPVFIRHIHDHGGPRTGLLHTRGHVAKALRSLRLRGYRLRDLMIAEFCNTADPEGVFRKYAAFKVADRIIPCHLLTSRNWCVKSVRNEPSEERVREGTRYLEENPHKAWLQQVFAVAGIDYGRVDYGVCDGAPQVWEINLNPTLGRASGWRRGSEVPASVKELREQSRVIFHSQLRDAFLALETGDRESDISITIEDALVIRLQKEATAHARRARLRNTLSGLARHPRLSLPVRVLSKLFPRY